MKCTFSYIQHLKRSTQINFNMALDLVIFAIDPKNLTLLKLFAFLHGMF